MSGAGTVLADDPKLTVRAAELPTYLPLPKKLRQPLRVIVDVHLSIPSSAQLLKLEGKTVIFTASDNADLKLALQQSGQQNGSVEVITLPAVKNGIDLQLLCQSLAKDYEVNELLLETGATLGGAMLRAELVDEIVLYMAPILMGHEARALFNLPQMKYLNQSINLEIKDIRSIGRDWRITARPIYAKK